MRWSILVLGVSVVSAVAGGAVALLLRPHPELRGPKAGALSLSDSPETAANTADLDRFELRIQQLEAHRASSSAPTASAASIATASAITPTSGPSGLSREESARRWLETMRQREAQVAAEPDDRAWSQHATATFRKEFEAMGRPGKFWVTDLECKTTSCLAKLRWASYGDAAKSWRSVLHGRYERNCARQVFVPPPEPGRTDSAYEPTMFLDCTADRAQ
jgi:hypothetical protein